MDARLRTNSFAVMTSTTPATESTEPQRDLHAERHLGPSGSGRNVAGSRPRVGLVRVEYSRTRSRSQPRDSGHDGRVFGACRRPPREKRLQPVSRSGASEGTNHVDRRRSPTPRCRGTASSPIRSPTWPPLVPRYGDTFVVEGPRTRRFPLLARRRPQLLRAARGEASKGVADWMMLVRKLPDELFDGRRTILRELFGRDDVRTYLATLDAAIDVAFVEIGAAGHRRRVRVHATARTPHGSGGAGAVRCRRATPVRRTGRRARRARRLGRVRAPRGDGRGGRERQAGRACRDGAGRGAAHHHRRHRGRARPDARPDDLFAAHDGELGRRRRTGSHHRHRARRDPRAPRLDVEPVRRLRLDARATGPPP